MKDNPIDYLIMEAIWKLIEDIFSDLPDDDPVKPRWVEVRPRNEDFADSALSMWISTNDPEKPGGWLHEAVLAWPRQKGEMRPEYAGRNFNTLGGGQGFYHRFTIGFFLLYTELGVPRDVALRSGITMMSRVHRAFVNKSISKKYFGKILHEEMGVSSAIFDYDKAVQKMESTPSGSEEDTIIRGKMWLEFVVYHEAM